MIALLAWPGAVAIGLSLGLLGSGGSILTVPVLVYLLGQDEKLAIAGSLAIVAAIAAAGSLPYVRERLVDWRNVLLFGVPGMAGTYLGAWASVFVSGTVQIAVFAVVMVVAAYFMLRPRRDLESAGPREIRGGSRITVDGLAVGALTGFVGVGGGFLVVPALVLLGGLTMHRAVATSLVIIAMKSAVGFAKYVQILDADGLALDVDVLITVAVIGIAGSYAGSLIGKRLPTERLQRYFGVFLVGMGAYILVTSVAALLG